MVFSEFFKCKCIILICLSFYEFCISNFINFLEKSLTIKNIDNDINIYFISFFFYSKNVILIYIYNKYIIYHDFTLKFLKIM